MTARSYLYVPGDDSRKLEGAPQRGADALILDLEDGVAVSAREAARHTVADWVARRATGVGCEVWVRIDPGEALEDDVAAVLHPGLHGIVLPKATIDQVARVDAAIARHAAPGRHADRGLVPVAALVESAAGVLEATAIARHPRISHLALGEADLAADLGIERSDDDAELRPLRLALVVASAAAGVHPPVGAVSTDFRDLERLRASTWSLRRLGFRGRSAIHPAQVPVINEVFTPSDVEIERARDLVARFDAAVAAGRGVVTDDDGRMVDEAVVRTARRTLELADRR